jgi:replicative DNA helicase
VNGETVLLEIGERVPFPYLADLSGMASGANTEYYLDYLVEEAHRRELRRLSLWLTEASSNGKPPSEVIESLEAQIAAVRRKTVDTADVDVSATLHQLVETMEQRVLSKATGPCGVPTGLRELDTILGGLKPGVVYILAARTSVGKTALTRSMADHRVRKGIPVGFCSLEMFALQLVERLVSMRSNVPVSRMKYGALRDGDMVVILDAAGTFMGGMRILDKPGLSLRGLRAWAHGAAGKGDRVLFVDYIGLLDISDDDRPRWEVMGQVSRTIKGLARELRMPIVALCQLNRMVASDGGDPELHHLRDSGSLEQDADVVLLLHRADPKETDGATMHANLKTAKNRSGPTGRIDLMFHRSICQFQEASARRRAQPRAASWSGRTP